MAGALPGIPGCPQTAEAELAAGRLSDEALLYQMGLNQDALSYMYLGRKERLTEVRGEIVKDIVA